MVTMADNQAAASLPLVDMEKVSPPLPVVVAVPAAVDDKVDVKLMPVKPASSLPISPPLAVMPADTNNKTTTTTPPAALPILKLIVCLWALDNAFVFAVVDVVTLILMRTPCTKSTWLFRCVTLTDAAAAEVTLLLYGELLCSAAAALPALLHMLLTKRTTASVRSRRWGAAVDALAWVALAATAAIHCVVVASDRIVLAAKPGDNNIFADAVPESVLLAVDLLAGVLLCCSPRCLGLGEQQGDDDGEV